MSLAAPARVLPQEEWLSIREASRLVGVSVATMRRWSDAGEVSAFTTPGGHRRFARSAVLGLASGSQASGAFSCDGETRVRVLRAYRRELQRTEESSELIPKIAGRARRQLRVHGTAIITALLDAIDANGPARLAALDVARRETTSCASIAVQHHVPLAQTLSLFIHLRGAFLRQVGLVASGQGRVATEAAALVVSASDALDELLPAVLGAYTESRAT